MSKKVRKSKNKVIKWHRIATIFNIQSYELCCITIILCIVLVIQFIRLEQRIKEVLVLRMQYEDCIQCTKNKYIDEYIRTSFNINNSLLPPVLVNRDEDYLKNTFLSFSKKYNIENSVQKVLEFHERGCIEEQKKLITHTINAQVNSNASRKKITERFKKIFEAQWPLRQNEYWLSSYYGPRKNDDGSWGFHLGLDMASSKGTPIRAVAAGCVKEVYYSQVGYGNTLVISHKNDIKTRYAHLDTITVSIGQKIRSGQVVGTVGATGHVKGRNASHLHFEVIFREIAIDPLLVLTS